MYDNLVCAFYQRLSPLLFIFYKATREIFKKKKEKHQSDYFIVLIKTFQWLPICLE